MRPARLLLALAARVADYVGVRVLLVSANREKLPSPVVPLGLLQVAANLREAHEVALCDLCFEEDPHDRLARDIAAFAPEVIGIGIRNLHTNAYDDTDVLIDEYAALVRVARAHTQVPIVLGGSGFSLQAESLLVRIGADYGVVGEGEHAMRAVVGELARGAKPEKLTWAATAGAGLVRGPMVRTPRTAQERGELDRLPAAARDLVDPRYYEWDGTDNVQTKRGCAFECAYCDYPDLEGRKVRVRDPEAVADEMLARSKVPGVTHAFIVDSVFNVPRSHALAVCAALEARGVPIPWVCYASPVNFDDELVGAMARAGCVGVEIGSDAGTTRVLEALRKPFGLAEIFRARELFVRHGVLDCHTFVLGAVDETVKEARATLEMVDRLDPDVAAFIVFMEDREAQSVHRARDRDALLQMLADEAPKRAGWVVPELGIRFGGKLARYVQRAKLRGPSWLHLAQMRRATRPAARAASPVDA